MNTVWESKDKQVKKEVISRNILTNNPNEKTSCEVLIEDVNITTIPDYPKEKLNSEYLNGPAEKTIVIGEACCIIDRNIERALEKMCLKEKSLVTIDIPPTIETENHSVKVVCSITLKHYKQYNRIWEWSENEKYETALKYKESGIQLYRSGRYIDAFFKFSQACKLLITMDPLDRNEEIDKDLVDKIEHLRVVTYNNMAECHLLQKNYNHVITLCTRVLNKDKDNVKALYRRGIAHGSQRNWEKAYADMKRVTELEPKNNLAKDKMNFYNEEIKKANQKMDNIMKKMFMAIPSCD